MSPEKKKYFYGRRKGRKISSTNSKLVNDFCHKFYLKEEQIFKLKYHEYKKNILEIGFGDGENLISNALNNLDSFYVGIEVYEAGVAKVLELIKKNNLENIFLIQGDAKAILEKNTTIKFFDEVIIFFPDPWPKRRHKKRRLLSNNFLYSLKMILKDKSVLKIKTDWDDYAQQIENDLNQIFSNTKKHINKKTDLFTKYEKTAIEEKRNIIYFEAY
mgnify:CR=1 FL=1